MTFSQPKGSNCLLYHYNENACQNMDTENVVESQKEEGMQNKNKCSSSSLDGMEIISKSTLVMTGT